MDEIAQYNADRWEALARAKAVFTRPRLDLTLDDAQMLVDPDHRLGEIAGKQVLCLAGGGGQQSAAFALLGAYVTVLDLSTAQLQCDLEAAAHYQLDVNTVQGDMRNLARFDPAAFDIVYHPYSINFVPQARAVFREVARVIRAGGIYFFNCANPFFSGLTAEAWDGNGYPLSRPYQDGMEITYRDELWVFRGELPREPIQGPKEYRHTLGTLINGLVEHGFAIQHVVEQYLGTPDVTAAPGTTAHFSAIAPPWLEFWASYRPDARG
jgi:SAM-dependent methyltransferase